MKIAVLSGKGGAGKTFAAVNLAVAAQQAVYADCDVEEPNGRLFFKPELITTEPVYTTFPTFDGNRCIGCRACVNFCRFNALVFIKNKPKVFPEVCHSCGGCQLVCPAGAVTEEKRQVGVVEAGRHGRIQVVTGVLNLGESSGIPVIEKVLETAYSQEEDIVIDCPPGSACPVMESVKHADYCVLVAEPTAFGMHNFQMVYELVQLMHRKCGVIINKMDEPYEPLENFCKEKDLPILARIPYSERIAELSAQGQIAAEKNSEICKIFQFALEKIRGSTI